MGRIKYSATPAAIVGGVLPYSPRHMSRLQYSLVLGKQFERRFFGSFTNDLKRSI